MVESWLAPVAASVSTREAVFDFADGQVFTLRANQRWRFWRRPLPKLDARLPAEAADPAALVELVDRYRLESPVNRLLAALHRSST